MSQLGWALVAWWYRPATWTRRPLVLTKRGKVVYDVVTAAALLVVAAVFYGALVAVLGASRG